MKSPIAAIAAALTLFTGALVAGCSNSSMPTSLGHPCRDSEIRTDILVYTIHPNDELYSGVPFALEINANGIADFPGVTLVDDLNNVSEENTHPGIGHRSWLNGRNADPYELTALTPFEFAVICYPRNEPSRIRITATYTIGAEDDGNRMDTYDTLECVIEDQYLRGASPEARRRLELLDLVKQPDLDGKRTISVTCDALYVPEGWVGDLPAEFPAPPTD